MHKSENESVCSDSKFIKENGRMCKATLSLAALVIKQSEPRCISFKWTNLKSRVFQYNPWNP